MNLSLTIGVKDIDFCDLEENGYIHIFYTCMKAKDYDLIHRTISECDEREDTPAIKHYVANFAEALIEIK